MEKQSADVQQLRLPKDQVLCVEGEKNSDLFYIESGKLLICVTKGSQVTPVAYLGPGEFLGELSFFDHHPRSANVISLEDSVLLKFPSAVAKDYFPRWLLTLSKFMTKRIRTMDELIRQKGIKKTNVETIRPLSIQEQGYYFKLIKGHKGKST